MKYATDRDTLERECSVEFYRATGPGGQHRNRRETAVRLSHESSGVVVTATERRSQALNLDKAYERMAEKLAALNVVPKKRKPTKTPKSAIEKRLTGKKKQAQKKQERKQPSELD